MAHQFEIWVLQQVHDISSCAGIKIIHTQDIVTVLEQAFAQVRAEKPGPPRDQDMLIRHGQSYPARPRAMAASSRGSGVLGQGLMIEIGRAHV